MGYADSGGADRKGTITPPQHLHHPRIHTLVASHPPVERQTTAYYRTCAASSAEALRRTTPHRRGWELSYARLRPKVFRRILKKVKRKIRILLVNPTYLYIMYEEKIRKKKKKKKKVPTSVR